jgi:molecular chaperone Hsp33
LHDYLVRATGAQGRVRVLVARTTDLVDDARRRHGLSATATAALGRALTGAALLGATLKGAQTVTLRVAGDGPLGGIVADADASGHVRGYARNGAVELPPRADGKLDVSGAVGSSGYLHVVRDLGLKQPYAGSCRLVSGEIAADLAAYFRRSEQIPSAVGLGVLVGPGGRVRGAGGYLLQLLPGRQMSPALQPPPGADDELARGLEDNVNALGGVSRWVAASVTPEQLARRLLGASPRILGRQPLAFACRCSPEKVRELVAAIGPGELDDAVASGEGVELCCRFCGTKYHYTAGELARVLAGAREAPPSGDGDDGDGDGKGQITPA